MMMEDNDDNDKKSHANMSSWGWWIFFCRHLRRKMMTWRRNGTVNYFYSNNKIILFCTHTIGYFIYKHHMVRLELKVNPQLHCCYQPQSIKHTHRKILSKMFLVFRKKRKHAEAFISKNSHITKKVLGYSVLSMIS